jgi:hypothetical protein
MAENEKVVAGVESEVEETETPEEELTDTTNWEAEAKKERGIRKRLETKLKKANEPKSEAPKVEEVKQKSGELDYGQRALLVAYGVKGPEEIALAKSWMQRTGDDIDVMIGDDIFTAKLTALREAKASHEAIPSGTKRAGFAPKDSVDYHLAKYESGAMQLDEMPFDMRSKVLTAKMEKEKKANEFSFTPNIK